jgi:hypothetical protein
MTVIAFARPFFPVNVAVNAQSMHFFIAFFAHVTGGAFPEAFLVVFFMMALYAFHAQGLVSLV